MDIHLLTHNVISILSSVVLLGMTLFTYLNGRRNVGNVTFSMMLLFAAIFVVSHVIGVNISDPELSKNILMFNLSLFGAGAFLFHSVVYFTSKTRPRVSLIIVMYAIAVFFVIFFLVYPDQFLISSVPKMYFPNYYNPGTLNLTRLIYLYAVFSYAIYKLVVLYRASTTTASRNQYRYFIFAMIAGFCVGFIPNFLVYDIAVNPLWGMSFALVAIVPFTYAAVKYELFNIKVIAKQAFLYSLSVIVVGSCLTLLMYVSVWTREAYPNFPSWTIMLVSSVLAVTISFVVWWRLRENDVLKYEFITTVTHKFRTPLTQIQWAADALSDNVSDADGKEQIHYIHTASTKMVELINILANVSQSEAMEYTYKIERCDISGMTKDLVSTYMPQCLEKRIQLVSDIPPDVNVFCDRSKMSFVFQVLIENAIHYTPENGTITVSLEHKNSGVNLKVRDTGIGMTDDELSRVFSKFYRTASAQRADTEGMGIGLFLSKEIVSRHGGDIRVDSDGLGKGSMFTLHLNDEA
ncbi:MAG: hypothetical protein A3G04_02145 [Candidatus Taylorbacteria bacterium RIFCSPLOWO2_12_FULL_44_9]|nr:MAG: hypothetical protein A3G04_02145 [Candidatus Taylorbacteria bacterium RIFCSPLOWO2_12_FULL_44_9]